MRMRKSKKITHHKKSHHKKILSHQKSKAKKIVTLSQHHPTPKRVKAELERSDVIQGMALLLQDYIMRYEQLSRPRCRGCNFPGPRIFNSTEYSQSPTMDQIQQFIQTIFDKRRLHVESGIIALILLNRTGINLHSQNWMRLLLISLLLANKHCEDVYSVYNAKFVGIIPHLENLEINIMELEFLKYLKYRLHIETETYEEYYANLQNYFPIEEEEDNSSNTEETDSIEEEDEYLSAAYSLLSTLDNSTVSTDTIDQNPRFSRKTLRNSYRKVLRETSRDDKSSTDDSAEVYLKPRYSPSISELGLHQSNTKRSILKPTKLIASSENLWRDCNFAKDASLA